MEEINPRTYTAFRHPRPCRGGGGWYDPPAVSKSGVVELRNRNQRNALDEISRLRILSLTLGQYLT